MSNQQAWFGSLRNTQTNWTVNAKSTDCIHFHFPRKKVLKKSNKNTEILILLCYCFKSRIHLNQHKEEKVFLKIRTFTDLVFRTFPSEYKWVKRLDSHACVDFWSRQVCRRTSTGNPDCLICCYLDRNLILHPLSFTDVVPLGVPCGQGGRQQIQGWNFLSSLEVIG